MLQDTESVSRDLQQLRALGVGISIDDFGTRYSTLNYVKHFAVDRLKIDRSTVANLIRLLDLPDEVLELIEHRYLTEGHGRALLMAPNHADRKLLARQAVTNRWSVRELESRARAADSQGPIARRRVHRRRALQQEYKLEHGIDPQTIRKAVTDILASLRGEEGAPTPGRDRRSRRRDRVRSDLAELPRDELTRLIRTLEEEMHEAATELRFEYAAKLRDEINDLKGELKEVVR